MTYTIRINGIPVMMTNLQRREIGRPDGSRQEELRLSLLIHGLPEQRAFLDHLAQRPLRLELPIEQGGGTFEAEIQQAAHNEVGYPERPAYRHTLSLLIIGRIDDALNQVPA